MATPTPARVLRSRTNFHEINSSFAAATLLSTLHAKQTPAPKTPSVANHTPCTTTHVSRLDTFATSVLLEAKKAEDPVKHGTGRELHYDKTPNLQEKAIRYAFQRYEDNGHAWPYGTWSEVTREFSVPRVTRASREIQKESTCESCNVRCAAPMHLCCPCRPVVALGARCCARCECKRDMIRRIVNFATIGRRSFCLVRIFSRPNFERLLPPTTAPTGDQTGLKTSGPRT